MSCGKYPGFWTHVPYFAKVLFLENPSLRWCWIGVNSHGMMVSWLRASEMFPNPTNDMNNSPSVSSATTYPKILSWVHTWDPLRFSNPLLFRKDFFCTTGGRHGQCHLWRCQPQGERWLTSPGYPKFLSIHLEVGTAGFWNHGVHGSSSELPTFDSFLA